MDRALLNCAKYDIPFWRRMGSTSHTRQLEPQVREIISPRTGRLRVSSVLGVKNRLFGYPSMYFFIIRYVARCCIRLDARPAVSATSTRKHKFVIENTLHTESRIWSGSTSRRPTRRLFPCPKWHRVPIRYSIGRSCWCFVQRPSARFLGSQSPVPKSICPTATAPS